MILKRARTLTWVSAAIILISLGFLILVPQLFVGNSFLISTFVFANIYSILAMSWDLLSGYTGQISFGHSFFFGIGAYTSALLSMHLGWSPLYTIPLGGVMASLGGLLVATPALRLRGPYLSLITLVSALGIDQLIRVLKLGSTGAEGAIQCEIDLATGVNHCVPPISANEVEVYYFALRLMVCIAIFLIFLVRSRIGLAFEAIRDDEEAAEAAGIDAKKYKILAFMISGFLAGLAGAVMVHKMQQASPGLVLDLNISIEAIVASVLGGMGTILGPVGGAYFYILIRELLRPFGQWRLFAVFVIALLILLFIPRGVLAEIRLRLMHWIKSEKPKEPQQGARA